MLKEKSIKYNAPHKHSSPPNPLPEGRALKRAKLKSPQPGRFRGG